jgi:DNA-binding transcriptional LysR family regulator
MNTRRLEIYYHVVRCGGIAAAARQMPQRLDLTTVSKQITLLEQELGFRLFERRPFRLTPAGRLLYAPLPQIQATLQDTLNRARRQQEDCFRLGVEDGLRLSLLLPAAVEWLQHEPNTRVELQTGLGSRLKSALEQGEIDLLVTLLDPEDQCGRESTGKNADRLPLRSSEPRPKLQTRILGTRPLVLLVPKAWPIRDADYFWRQKVITERLITPAPDNPLMRSFTTGLQRGSLRWPAQITTDSITNVLPFVAAGLGAGITFDLPANTQHPKVRILPVAGFDPVTLACHWRAVESHRLQPALQLAQRHAQ